MADDEDYNMEGEDPELENLLDYIEEEGQGQDGEVGGSDSDDDDQGDEAKEEEKDNESILSPEWDTYKGKYLNEFVQMTKESFSLLEKQLTSPETVIQAHLKGVNRVQAIIKEIDEYEAANWTARNVEIPRRAVYEDLIYSGLIHVLLDCLGEWTFSEQINKGDGDKSSSAQELRSRVLAIFDDLIREPKIGNHLTIVVPTFMKLLTNEVSSAEEHERVVSILTGLVAEKVIPHRGVVRVESPEMEWRKREIIGKHNMLNLFQNLLNSPIVPQTRPSLLEPIFDGVRDMISSMNLKGLDAKPILALFADLLRSMEGLKGHGQGLKASFYQAIMFVGPGELVEDPAAFISQNGLLQVLMKCINSNDEEDLLGVVLPICTNFMTENSKEKDVRVALDAGVMTGISALLQRTDVSLTCQRIILEALAIVADLVPEKLPVALVPDLITLAKGATMDYVTNYVIHIVRPIIEERANYPAVAADATLDFFINIVMNRDNEVSTDDLSDSMRFIKLILRHAKHGDQALRARVIKRVKDKGVLGKAETLLSHEGDDVQYEARKLKEALA